jgi:hypothetical protein
MAYDKKELEKLALKSIKEHKLIDIEQIVSFMPCSSKTFYNHELPKLQTIKEAVIKSKIENKNKLFKKWIDSENATLQIAAYKLMADDNELNKLTSSRFDHASKDGSMTPQTNIITTLTPDEFKKSLEQ